MTVAFLNAFCYELTNLGFLIKTRRNITLSASFVTNFFFYGSKIIVNSEFKHLLSFWWMVGNRDSLINYFYCYDFASDSDWRCTEVGPTLEIDSFQQGISFFPRVFIPVFIVQLRLAEMMVYWRLGRVHFLVESFGLLAPVIKLETFREETNIFSRLRIQTVLFSSVVNAFHFERKRFSGFHLYFIFSVTFTGWRDDFTFILVYNYLFNYVYLFSSPAENGFFQKGPFLRNEIGSTSFSSF